MKLLQHSWSEILILDFVHRLVRETWSGEVLMVSFFCFYFYSINRMYLYLSSNRVHEIPPSCHRPDFFPLFLFLILLFLPLRFLFYSIFYTSACRFPPFCWLRKIRSAVKHDQQILGRFC